MVLWLTVSWQNLHYVLPNACDVLTSAGLDTVRELGLSVIHAGTKTDDKCILTNGGRVLAVTAIDTDLPTAVEQAQVGAATLQYKGKFYRKDIAQKALRAGK